MDMYQIWWLLSSGKRLTYGGDTYSEHFDSDRGRGTEQMKFVKVFNFMIGIQSVSGYEETVYWEKGWERNIISINCWNID